jgi:8-oxo-dGTP pyrophosphatase MutT (NUDIX family)
MPCMDLFDITHVLSLLRLRLQPLTAVDSLVDVVEGVRPLARRAAVLVACFVRDGEVQIIFIRRAATLRAHGGEIAFPGGSYEAEDASLLETAVREAAEEIGLLPERVELLGLLPPVFTVVSNFLVTPVVAYLPAGPGELHRQVDEVAEVLSLPLRELADAAIAHQEVWTHDGETRTVYFYDYGPHRIWGATGRMLYSLLDLLQGRP